MEIRKSHNWGEVAVELNAETFHALIADRIAAIHVRSFIENERCAAFAAASREVAASGAWQARTSPMQVIGGNFANYVHMDPETYFATVADHEADRDRVFARSFDPVALVSEALQALWEGPVTIASERGKSYFAGGIKLRTQASPIHFDYVPFFTDDYALGGVKEQLSWNIYFAMPKRTGHTDVFGAKVQSVPARLHGPHANRVDPALLEDVPYVTLRPQVGDLALFCTRHPHRVVMEDAGADELRIQIGCFLGLMDDGRLVMWS